jgi:hypothetical protein
MKTAFMIGALMISFADASRADVSDSGNLTLGGCVKFGDGSQQCSAAAAISYNGVNYVFSSSSGTVIAYSTGATSFHVAQATMVFRGGIYNTPDTYFSMGKSTYSIVYWNPTNGFRQFGLAGDGVSTISSFTVKGIVTDDIAVALSTTGTNGDTHVFQIANMLSQPSMGGSFANRYMPNVFNSAITLENVLDCPSGKLYFQSCSLNAITFFPFVGPQFEAPRTFMTGGNDTSFFAVVNNTGGASANLSIASASEMAFSYRLDGAAPTRNAALGSLRVVTLSIPTGYHVVSVYEDYNANNSVNSGFTLTLPPNVVIVRPGYW